jgi:hypothetical protein
MDAVRSDIVGFWEGGGWDFLDAEGDLEDPNKPKRKKKKNAQMPEESEQGGGENAEEGGDEDDEENAPFMEFGLCPPSTIIPIDDLSYLSFLIAIAPSRSIG